MSIIDKLGIQQIKQFECIGRNGLRKNAVCETSEVRELEDQRNEMLEILIDIAYATWDYCIKDTFYHDEEITEQYRIEELENSDFPKLKKLIEKVSKKSWEEIQELQSK